MLKKQKAKIFGLLLAVIVLLTSLSPFSVGVSATEEPEVANVTGVYVFSDTKDSLPVWRIRVITDKTIEVRYSYSAGGENYWNGHLHQPTNTVTGEGKQAERDALMLALRSSLAFNKKTLAKVFADTGDIMKAAQHVETNGVNLDISLKQDGNEYGVSNSGYFTFEISEGLTINGFTIEPGKYAFDPNVHASRLTRLPDEPDEPKVANVTGVYVYSDTKDSLPVWRIRVITDQTIEVRYNYGGGESYWNGHLHQPQNTVQDGKQAERDALMLALRSSLAFNGKTLAKVFADTGDIMKAAQHVETNGVNLDISLKQGGNEYGVSNSGYFSFEILEGLTINGFTIEPGKYAFDPSVHASRLTRLPDEPDEPNEANVTGITISFVENIECVPAWLIMLTFDKDITTTGSGSWPDGHLNIVSQQTGDRVALANALNANIVLDGKTIQQGAVEKNAPYVIQRMVTENNNKLLMYITADYGTFTSPFPNVTANTDFTFEIKSGITMNGWELAPVKYVYTASTKEFTLFLGDADGDGHITIIDLLTVKSHLLGGTQLDDNQIKRVTGSKDIAVTETHLEDISYILLKK